MNKSTPSARRLLQWAAKFVERELRGFRSSYSMPNGKLHPPAMAAEVRHGEAWLKHVNNYLRERPPMPMHRSNKAPRTRGDRTVQNWFTGNKDRERKKEKAAKAAKRKQRQRG